MGGISLSSVFFTKHRRENSTKMGVIVAFLSEELSVDIKVISVLC